MYKFSKDFLWGSATSAYQVEGAIHQGGKGINSWDEYYKINDLGYDGDYAADHYNNFREDIALMREINQQTYRFSVSWARIFPDNMSEINIEGVDFYRNLINELKKNGIEPNLTLYHWDLPIYLLEIGGWENRDIIEYFGEYCRFLFKEFGDVVNLWSTINEPQSEVLGGYVQGAHPPQVKDYKRAIEVSHILNLAHAKAIEIFREEKVDGKIGIALNPMPIYTIEDSYENKKAAKIAYDYYSNWYLSPILKGEYPSEMFEYCKKTYGAPTLLDGDIETLKKNKIDYLGINYYMRRVVKAKDLKAYNIHDKFEFIRVPDGNYTEWGWEVYPDGLYDLLKQIEKDYGKHTIMITENGMGFNDEIDEKGNFIDSDRLEYIQSHIQQIARCLNDGIDIKAYYVWSTLDLLSWTNGFSKRYGLIGVDFKTMERRIKKSGHWYKNFIEKPEIEEYNG